MSRAVTRKLGGLVVLLLLVVGLIISLMQEQRPSVPPPTGEISGIEAKEGNESPILVHPNQGASAKGAIEPPDSVPLNQSIPSQDQVRREVEENPHQTPPSLLDFAAAMAERMENARASRVSAEALMGELGECVRAEQHPASLHAICLKNAQILSEVHPGLSTRFKEINQSASHQARELLEQMKRLGSG